MRSQKQINLSLKSLMTEREKANDSKVKSKLTDVIKMVQLSEVP